LQSSTQGQELNARAFREAARRGIYRGRMRSAGWSVPSGSDSRFRLARIRPRGLLCPLGRPISFLPKTPTLTAVSNNVECSSIAPPAATRARLTTRPQQPQAITWKAFSTGTALHFSNHTVTPGTRTTSTPKISTSRFHRRPPRTRRRPPWC
jgi:hypothetical protein